MIKKVYLAILRRFDPIKHARRIGVQLGDDCRLIDVSFGSEPWLIKLGNHVSISDTRFVTHDGGVWVFREKHPKIDCVAPIVVGNNVFIGSGTIILPGVTIGDNVVIGAGSVVTRDIPSNCVVAGIPARSIRSLDEYEMRIIPQCDLSKGGSREALQRLHKEKFPWLWNHEEKA
jgi:acetyltransferase-like isoleucine patch superfamily enzyme